LYRIVHPPRAAIERTSNVAVSVRQRPRSGPRPPYDHAAVSRITRRAAGDAGGACADHDNVSVARQWRRPRARSNRGVAANAADAERKPAPASLSCHGFRNFDNRQNFGELAASGARAATVMVNQS